MDLKSLIGLGEVEARTQIAEFGKLLHRNIRVRIMRRDRQECVGDCRHDLNRINLEFDNGKVTKVWRG